MSLPAGASSFVISGGEVVLPDRVIRGGIVFVHEGAIRFAGPGDKPTGAAAQPGGGGLPHIDATGLLVCPTLWEPHIHGCVGASTEQATSESLRTMGTFLASQGVGAFLPATVSDEGALAGLGTAIDALGKDSSLRSRIPGIHVEGPFIEPAKKGGIPEGCIRPVSLDYLDRLLGIAKGSARVMTLAPELTGAAELIHALAKRGIVPSLGHSAARFEDLIGFDGVSPLSVTHLFNAMSGLSHREPGLAQWALLNREAYTEIIADLVHVHPAAVQLALRARPWERIVLISDAIAASGLSGGDPGTLYGKVLEARGNGLYYADSGTLVGSRAFVRDGVAILVGRLGVGVPAAVAMASLNPARMLGYEHKGALLSGYDADIALFAKDFSRCEIALWRGAPIFERSR